MDHQTQVRDFLTTRRARLGPAQVGLPDVGRRRVPGLRRSEVATLAGLSVEYYARLERGSLAGASPAVLDAVARALQLDETDRTHLQHLAQGAEGTAARLRPRRRTRTWGPPVGLTWVLDRFTAPAIIRNGRMDLLAANHLGRAMNDAVHAASAGQPGVPPNFARFTFLHRDAAERFYPDWSGAADTCVAILQAEAGRAPHDKDLHDLVGELSTLDADFRARWGRHDVRYHGAGTKTFHHDQVGELDLTYESLDMLSEPGLTLTLYAAEPASATAHALDLLGSWAAPSAGASPAVDGHR